MNQKHAFSLSTDIHVVSKSKFRSSYVKPYLSPLCPRLENHLICFLNILYSNKKETSDFHGTVSFGPVKMSQQK